LSKGLEELFLCSVFGLVLRTGGIFGLYLIAEGQGRECDQNCDRMDRKRQEQMEKNGSAVKRFCLDVQLVMGDWMKIKGLKFS
jgi:hypothetical protein